MSRLKDGWYYHPRWGNGAGIPKHDEHDYYSHDEHDLKYSCDEVVKEFMSVTMDKVLLNYYVNGFAVSEITFSDEDCYVIMRDIVQAPYPEDVEWPGKERAEFGFELDLGGEP